MPTPSCCDPPGRIFESQRARRPADFGIGRLFSGRASQRSAARSRMERTSVLQLLYRRPRDWPTTPLATHLLSEFQLRRREKFLYTYDFLDLWEWEIRVLDIEPGSAEAWRPHCLAGRAATPPEECGGPPRVHANSGSAQVLSAHGRRGAGREGLAAHGESAAEPGSLRLAQGAVRSRAGQGRTTAQRTRTISTRSLQPAGGQ
jgi:hypothetical protein